MHRVLASAAFAFLLLIGTVAIAADDPTGTWKWTVTRGDMKRDVTLKLKLEGDKLTGTMPGRNNTETAIENGSFKDGVVKFEVTREFNGNKVTTKYNGKLEGNKITGKTERPGRDGGAAVSTDWVATKE
jgi:hypothetical protein